MRQREMKTRHARQMAAMTTVGNDGQDSHVLASARHQTDKRLELGRLV